MWPDRVSDPGPLTYESAALPTALRGPATIAVGSFCTKTTISGEAFSRKDPQQTHDVTMTSYRRRCDVPTSHRRHFDVISPLGPICAGRCQWIDNTHTHTLNKFAVC